MTKPNSPASKSMPDFPFNPVPLRERHDGWTADRQIDFIDALATSGCVMEAARTVGLSVRSAYHLRAHPEGGSFRAAWDNATEFAMQRLHDAVLSRAIKGVPIPHYFQGKKVGEHRRYDERLAQFLLRTRKPGMFGRYAENLDLDPQPELYAVTLARAIHRLQCEQKALEAHEREAADALMRGDAELEDDFDEDEDEAEEQDQADEMDEADETAGPDYDAGSADSATAVGIVPDAATIPDETGEAPGLGNANDLRGSAASCGIPDRPTSTTEQEALYQWAMADMRRTEEEGRRASGLPEQDDWGVT